MAYTRRTGGNIEFHYKEGQVKSPDTDSTLAFKKALKEERARKAARRKRNKIIGKILIAVVVIYLVLRLLKVIK